MNEKEKAKAYDEAVERAKKLYSNGIAEEIFPELKESEDEKIKNAILNHLKKMWGNCQDDVCGVHVEDAIDWLEKQGENSADKIEPIFKVGEWVVNKFGDSWHIDSLDKKNYQVSDGKGNYNYFPIPKQDEMRLWNILDAKDGDVLCYRDDIILFKSYFVLQGNISMYCWYNRNTNNFYSKEIIYILSTKYKIYPATKEQRDTFMKVMNDAGYEWDAKKKELNKKEKLLKDG